MSRDDHPTGPRRRDPDAEATATVTFDGRELPARPGEPLAAALLANGIRTVAAGTYTGRPRGVYGIGPEEPCALVRVDHAGGGPADAPTAAGDPAGAGRGAEVMVPATTVEVRDGLRAGGLAGFARLPEERPTPRGDRIWGHCDVLVVGGGPAGLAAAAAAAKAGARVILADERPDLGGDLVGSRRRVAGRPAGDWVRDTVDLLTAHPEVRVLTRTAVTGHYDHGELIALQRWPATDRPRPVDHRVWHLRAQRVVLATGAHERPVAFAGNDRPGVMLAGAAARYARHHGVLPGRRAVVFGCHDEALWSAVDLHDAGVELAAVADARRAPGSAPVAALRERGVAVRTGTGVPRTRADRDTEGHLAGATLAPIDAHGTVVGAEEDVDCDLLAVSGGYNPASALAAHAGARQRWSSSRAAFIPVALSERTRCIGAAAGSRDPEAVLREGRRAGQAAAREALGDGPATMEPAVRMSEPEEGDGEAPPAALWLVTGPDGATDATEVFLDLQRDATLADLRAALAAGMTAIEHIKRYTTIGTGPDQGRTSGVLTTGVVAQLLGRTMDQVGGTTARPPAVPVPFTALAGRERGELLDPARHTPMHEWHVAHGAVFEDVGQWKRARYYPRDNEDMRAAVLRECRTTRESVGVLDASTLGKIIVEGRDAGTFLDRIYTGNFSTLRVGRCRYGVMCTADGMVLDDGVAVRLADHRYLVTTTSGNADTVLAWLEEWAQTEWPELCVHMTHVTDHWATVSVVGPRSRDIMRRLAPGLDVSAEGFLFMTFRDAVVAGAPARVLRVSFTGELTFEVNVPAWYGRAVWEAVLAAGEPFGITPYGTETMHVLRAEKGLIVVGHETDGNVTPADLGMGWALSKRKDFIGKRSLTRPDTARADREQLVGLLPDDTAHVVAEGAQLVAAPPAGNGGAPVPPVGRAPVPMEGRVTSSYDSAALGRSFALGLLKGGRERHGERLYAVHLDHAVPVLVTDPVFYDREGERRDG